MVPNSDIIDIDYSYTSHTNEVKTTLNEKEKSDEVNFVGFK